ncbi:MAG: ATP-binding cassette domain-containing protein [Gaiellales bacterium]|nr:MAG: ATP-binding cassette domain-containing protein [Gaiellales bacterium]
MDSAAEAARPDGSGGSVIEVEGLTRRFGELTAVDDVSFSVGRREIFGFLGPNGAGKTTTINMLCTLLRPTSGRATLNGHDVATEQDEVRQSIGIVFQDPTLDERLTARENLQFHAMLYNVPPGERRERARSVLDMVELTARADDRVETYSGGMRRRLEIARGLMHYPRVLFLDEPTLGLDPQTRRNIWEHVGELREQYDITIFMTTHYMDEAENCDRIAIIDNGRIAALDTPGNLKHEVGGDIITLRVEDAGAVARELGEKFGLDAEVAPPPWRTGGPAGERLRLEVPSGRTFLPRLLKGLDAEILSVTVREPTLDDVFLKLTGRQIREEAADGMEGVRARVRSRKVMRH